MENVFFISDYSDANKSIVEKLEIPTSNIIAHQTKENEAEYHSWLNEIFKSQQIDKIIIPVSIANEEILNTDGLLLGMHIRLNYELLLENRLIPIIFLSNFTIENIIKHNSFNRDNNPQNLLFTKEVYLSSFDLDEINKVISNTKKCSKTDYYNQILPQLNIHRKADFGGHDIANAWGCFKIAQAIGIDNQIFQLDSISTHLKQLYAKYLICKNETFSTDKRIDLNPIKCEGKNILFIDDKSNEGWARLMQHIFKGARDNFVYVDSLKYKADDKHKSFKDFDGFYKECQSHIGKKWDLIIVDLRLNPEKEDIDNDKINPIDLTGYKLINEFLSENEGYQIIVLTASNKIWNINSALKRGAYSYYIKESPEFNYPLSETNTHLDKFKDDVNSCFNRAYMRDIYNHWKNAKNKKTNLDENIINDSNASLDIAWELIKNEHLDLGYLTLFQAVERYAESAITYNNAFKTYELNDINIIEASDSFKNEWALTYNSDSSNGDYFSFGKSNQDSKRKPTTLFKISSILRFQLEKNDEFLKRFGKLNKIRNKIAHGEKVKVTKEEIIDILKIIEEIRGYL